MDPVLIVRYGLYVTVWVYDVFKEEIVNVNKISWWKYMLTPFPKAIKIIRTTKKIFERPSISNEQIDEIKKFLLNVLKEIIFEKLF